MLFRSKKIEISFNEEIDGYIIQLPDFVELDMLKNAKFQLEKLLLESQRRTKFSVLLDTGAHEFESIECLKYLRGLLSIKPLVENCRIFASVAPESHVKAEFKSDKEAVFNEHSLAYAWLKNSHTYNAGNDKA